MKIFSQSLLQRILVGLVIMEVIASCATPIAPSGGEPDRTGPKLISTSPATGTTQFVGDEIRFDFEDWVDRASFQRALSIEPGLDLEYDIKWRRKTAIIQLKGSLPDSTTVIFSLDKELRDTRSNRITQPIQIALSTGDEIDRGSVSFKVIPAFPTVSKTEPVVLLYREPFDISQPALYVSSADTSGAIRFNYLADGNYRAILVHDINRNRKWDRDREFAQPMNIERFNVNEVDTSEYMPFYYAKRDTTRPFAQNMGLFSSNRLRIQFSKAIPYRPNNELTLTDSLGTMIKAYHLYNDVREQAVAYFQTESSLEDSRFYQITESSFSDANGNPLRIGDSWFEGSSEADTTVIRYIAPYSGEALIDKDSLYIRYSTLIDDSAVLDSLKIYVNREEASGSFNIVQDKNRLIINPKSSWNSSNSYQIRTWNPYTATYKDVRIQVADEAESGDLNVVISDSLQIQNNIILTLYQPTGVIFRQVSFRDSVLISDIRPGTYHLLLFEQSAQDKQINYGSIDPFYMPGFIYADPRFPIRSRMSSELILE